MKHETAFIYSRTRQRGGGNQESHHAKGRFTSTYRTEPWTTVLKQRTVLYMVRSFSTPQSVYSILFHLPVYILYCMDGYITYSYTLQTTVNQAPSASKRKGDRRYKLAMTCSLQY